MVRIEFSDEEINFIIKLYTEFKFSKLKIADIIKYDASVVNRVLKNNKIPMRGIKFNGSKCFVDENYFKIIDTQDKAYWLGFLYADGSVGNKHIGLKLSIKDYNHIIKFSDCLKSTYVINKIINKNGFGIGNECCQIKIYNKSMVNDLINLGCIKNKSKTLMFPKEYFKECLMRHFIRGYFDGDGSIYYSIEKKYKYLKPVVSFTGTLDVLQNIKNILVPNSNINVRKYKDKDIYDLKIGGLNYIKDIYKYFYNDSEMYLDRKKEKFEEIFKLTEKRLKNII
jgi:hypothetical protein